MLGPTGSSGQRDPRVHTVCTGDGIALHVEEDGPADAPVTAVFVHGYCLNLDSWCLQRLGLAEPGDPGDPAVRRVFYDLRSHGRSAHAPSETATLDRLADDLGELVRAVAPGGRVVLVGHSMGGMVVLALAERQPELFTGPVGTRQSGPSPQVAGLALLATSTGRWSATAAGLPALFARVHGSLTAPLVHHLVGQVARGLRWRATLLDRARQASRGVVLRLTRWYSFGPAEVQPWLVDRVCTMICATPVEVVADFLPVVTGHDRRAALDALADVPTLVLVGDRDRLTPLAHSRALADRLPDPELVVLPGAGHMITMEQPDLVNAHLRTLLRRVVR